MFRTYCMYNGSLCHTEHIQAQQLGNSSDVLARERTVLVQASVSLKYS